jgi:hypothetical protein
MGRRTSLAALVIGLERTCIADTDLDARSASANDSRCNRYQPRCAMRAEIEHSANW